MSPNADKNVFVTLFIISFVGSSIVTFNGILLGTKLSFLQTVCIMGYCMFPVDLAALIIYFMDKTGTKHQVANIIIGACAFLWSTTCKFDFFL